MDIDLEESFSSTESSIEDTIVELETQILSIKNSTDHFLDRLDSIQELLKEELFDIGNYTIQTTTESKNLELLLVTLHLDHTTPTVNTILLAFNQYIVQENLVKYSDFSIQLNPLLQTIFETELTSVNNPYELLLKYLFDSFV